MTSVRKYTLGYYENKVTVAYHKELSWEPMTVFCFLSNLMTPIMYGELVIFYEPPSSPSVQGACTILEGKSSCYMCFRNLSN